MRTSYREFVEAQVYRNPCLRGLADFLSRSPYSPSDNVPVHCLDFSLSHEGTTKVIEKTIRLDVCLSDISHSIRAPPEPPIRRIMCIEDINPYTVERLGAILEINPLFFATNINTSFVGIDKAPPPPVVALFPSSFAAPDSLHLHYQRVIKVPTSSGRSQGPFVSQGPGNVSRNVRCLTTLSGTQPGLIRSCCSTLLKALNNQSWICLLLVDSTDAPLVMPSSSTTHDQNYGRSPQVPLQGGFEDFTEMQSYSEFCATAKYDNAPPKSSILRSIFHYYRNLPPNFDPANPSIMALSYYPLKIVAAEWMIYVQLMSCYVKFYEYSFGSSERRSTEADIVELQRWRRRSKQSLHKLYLVEVFLAKHLGPQSTTPQIDNDLSSNPYATLREDYRYLSTQVEHYSRSLEFILPVAATIVQLTESRRSITEAVNVRYLTYIALIFVPLTFASGLFSMQDGFLPGQGRFWIYIVVAVSLVIVVLALSLVTPIVHKRWKQVLQ
ncbi:hypothetical protein F5B19DRAFT_454446 [Rostrohypoxylon terebratum]|nr:hypothetical protein F5B19DRAFT_454446 [Rostrohypoxylon terebratum]